MNEFMFIRMNQLLPVGHSGKYIFKQRLILGQHFFKNDNKIHLSSFSSWTDEITQTKLLSNQEYIFQQRLILGQHFFKNDSRDGP